MPSTDQDIAVVVRHPLSRAVVVVAVLALLAIVAMGGLREARSRESLPQVGAGQVARSDAYDITPLCAFTSDRMPGRRYPDAGKRYVVLRARVVNRMEYDWSHLQQDVVWPADGRGVAGPAEWLLRADDHSLGAQLPPGVPALVELVWPVPAGMATVEGKWGLYQRTRMTRHLDTGEAAWLQQAPGTRIVLPVSATCPEAAA